MNKIEEIYQKYMNQFWDDKLENIDMVHVLAMKEIESDAFDAGKERAAGEWLTVIMKNEGKHYDNESLNKEQYLSKLFEDAD